MSQGYIFFGIDQYRETKNLECAYALSVSLKMSDPDRETCVVVHKFADVPKKYEGMFDYIIELPYGRTEPNHHDFRIDWWQIYYASPFDESIYLDTYSLALDNVSSLWDAISSEEILFGCARDYRGDIARNNWLFQTQDNNKILGFDTRMVYFRKSKTASEFFKIADPIFKNWREVYTDLLTKVRVSDFDMTLLVNMTAKQTSDDIITNELFDFTDASLDIFWDSEENEQPDSWRKIFNIWFADDGTLKINNHRQSGIFYYDEPEFVNKTMITRLNDNYRKKKNPAKI